MSAYHAPTQKRYYEKNKKKLNAKKNEYLKRIRKLARLAREAGLDKEIKNK